MAFARGAECFSSPNNNALCQRFFVQINEQKRVSVCRSRGTREFVGAVLVGGREEGGFKKRMMTKEKGVALPDLDVVSLENYRTQREVTKYLPTRAQTVSCPLH